MTRDEGMEGVVLGGTELPLALGDTNGLTLRFFNTTLIHVERVIDLVYPRPNGCHLQQ